MGRTGLKKKERKTSSQAFLHFSALCWRVPNSWLLFTLSEGVVIILVAVLL